MSKLCDLATLQNTKQPVITDFQAKANDKFNEFKQAYKFVLFLLLMLLQLLLLLLLLLLLFLQFAVVNNLCISNKEDNY